MPKFVIRVIETRDYPCDYTIEADTEEDALEAAEIGETDDEYEGDMMGVTNREVMGVLSVDGVHREYPPDEPPTPDCGHDSHEDCMCCSICGKCSETLDDDDVCDDCREADRKHKGQD